MEDFCVRLRKAMEIRGVKQIELARRADMTRGTVSRYVRGEREPMSRQLTMIARALDVSETWLMGYDISMERTQGATLSGSTLEEFEQLTPEQ